MLNLPLSGYRRADGRVGVRNLTAVMAAADNVNPFARQLSAMVPGTICLPASYGRGQLGEDLETTLLTMAGLASHPNIAECLIVSFDMASAERIAVRIPEKRNRVQILSLLEENGPLKGLEKGALILGKMAAQAARLTRQPATPADFFVGLECGGSDTTSGLFGNPALGILADEFIDAGGTAVFSEPVECLGGEELIIRRARTPKAADEMVAAIHRFRDIALSQKVDLAGINPTADNIAGGLTTIEEKSLGALAKSGSRPIEGLLGYGEEPPGPGLWFMDAPAAGVENLTALAAAGAQVVFFVTGSGNPIGHPVSPTIKICANPQTAAQMGEIIDVDLSDWLTGKIDSNGGARRIADVFFEVADGAPTAAEKLGYLESNISRFGLSI